MVRKRLALASVVLLLAVVVAAVVGGYMAENNCTLQYTLITPDGMTFDFWGVGRAPGSEATLQAHEGFGLPPVRHVTQDIYNVPGNLLVDVVVQGRTVTITESVYATDRKGLHKALAEIWDAVRWDRGATRTTPSILRYTVDGNSWDLYVVLSGVVEGRQGRYGRNEIVGLRFEAHDPLWYSTDTEEVYLDLNDTINVTRIVRRSNGSWSNMNGGIDSIGWSMIQHSNGYVYVGGSFHNVDGIAASHIGRYDPVTNVWSALGVGADDVVYALVEAPDGRIYAAGAFLNIGGVAANYIAVFDPVTNAWSALGVGLDNVANQNCLAVGVDGRIYVGGAFHNAGGAGALHIAVWDPATLAWAALGVGVDDQVLGIARGPTGDIFVCGHMHNAGGAGALHVARWDPVAGTWSALGAGVSDLCYGLAFAPNGTLYLGGLFITAGGVTVNRVATWNGISFGPLSSGVNGPVYQAVIAPDGSVYYVGAFSTAGGVALYDRVARWNGHSWSGIGADLPGGPVTYCCLITPENDLYLTFTTTGNGTFSATVTPSNLGNAAVYPIITIYNQGTLQQIRNETTGQEILFNLGLNAGEITTIDLSTTRKTIGSNWRPNLLGYSLPNSDLGGFKLESDPRAANGQNIISAFMTGTAASEFNDDGGQLSGWDNVTGVDLDNSNEGVLYASVVAGAVNRVDFYMDAARTLLVGHTANYAAAGPVAVNEDAGSGLGGVLTVDAGGWPGANDADIYVYFTLCEMRWTPRFWSVDQAILAAEN